MRVQSVICVSPPPVQWERWLSCPFLKEGIGSLFTLPQTSMRKTSRTNGDPFLPFPSKGMEMETDGVSSYPVVCGVGWGRLNAFSTTELGAHFAKYMVLTVQVWCARTFSFATCNLKFDHLHQFLLQKNVEEFLSSLSEISYSFSMLK